MKLKFISPLLLALFGGAAMADDARMVLASAAEQPAFPTKALRDADAMYRRALRYETGADGVKPDHGKMLTWLKRASRKGSGLATYKLYTYYAIEPTGYTKASQYWSLAQQQGYCGQPVIGNVRGPKIDYVVQPQCASR